MSDGPTTATELAEAMRRGDLSLVEAVNLQLRRIESLDPGLGAFCSTFTDRVTERAARLDERQRAGEPAATGQRAGGPAILSMSAGLQRSRRRRRSSTIRSRS